MNFKFTRNFITISTIILYFFSCAGKELRMTVQGASYCLSSKIHINTIVPTMEVASMQMNDLEMRNKFSPKSLRLAIAYGIFEDLKKFSKLNLNAKSSAESLRLEDKIFRTIQLMILDIDSTTSEYECYVDRFTEILTMMNEKEDDIVRNNTLYAIMAGAMAAIADGATSLSDSDKNANQAIILVGGLLVAYFSYKAFKPNITIEFKPKSTNLKEIWFNSPKSENYSTSLWFLLTKDLLKNELPIRDLLVKRWLENNFLGTEEERDFHINLFFGTGGVSTITHISNRKEMNNEVRSLVNLLKQDVKGLQIEFLNLKQE